MLGRLCYCAVPPTCVIQATLLYNPQHVVLCLDLTILESTYCVNCPVNIEHIAAALLDVVLVVDVLDQMKIAIELPGHILLENSMVPKTDYINVTSTFQYRMLTHNTWQT
jgi:aromatic ring hydroxylase